MSAPAAASTAAAPTAVSCSDKVATFYLRHACKVFWSGIVVLLVLTMPASEMANFSAQSTHEYTVTESDVAREFDSADLAMKAVDSLAPAGTVEVAKPRAFPSSQWGQFTAMYRWDEATASKHGPGPDATIFTPRSVQQICTFEQTMFDHTDYEKYCVIDYDDKFGRGNTSCVTPTTVPTRLFYETTVLDCADQMSRSFAAAGNTTLVGLASDPANCRAIAEGSALPLLHYVNDKILATPSVLGMPAFRTSSSSGAMPERVPIFNYSAATPATDCPLLPQEHVDDVNAYLMAMLVKADLGDALGNIRGEDIFGFFMADDTVAEGYTRASRTFYALGAPLAGYVDEFDDSAAQREEYFAFAKHVEEAYFKRFGMVNAGAPTPRSAYRSKAVEEGVDFEFYALLFQLGEFTRTMNGDLPMTFLAVLFVWGYITFHTRSIFLSNMAMIQILLSLPVSYTVYKYVWGIPFFSQLHILAIFLVLGVGADDVFVITDAWKETLFTVDPADASTDGKSFDRKDAGVAAEYRRQRLRFAYSRTVVAVFNTSFTTAMAFVATGVSPIMSIATFGWFAATCIVMNYVITVTWYPAVIIVKEQYVDFYLGRKVTKARTEENPHGMPAAYPVPPEKETAVVKCFRTCYVPAMTKKQGPLPARAIPLIVVIVLLAQMIQAAYFTGTLSPPEEEEQFFPVDHMFTGLQGRLIDNYMGGAESSYSPMSFTFGIKAEEIDRSDYNEYYPDVDRGVTKYDADFDIYPKANQDALVAFCETIKNKVCEDVDSGDKLKGCAVSSRKLARGGTMQVRPCVGVIPLFVVACCCIRHACC